MPCSLLCATFTLSSFLRTYCKPFCACLWVTPLPWGSAAVAKELLISPEPPLMLYFGQPPDGIPTQSEHPPPALKHFSVHITSNKERKVLASDAAICIVSQNMLFMNLQLITPQAVYLNPYMFSHTKETRICTRRSGANMATLVLEAAI